MIPPVDHLNTNQSILYHIMNFKVVKMNDAKYVTVSGLNDRVADIHAEADLTANMICAMLRFVDRASRYIHLTLILLTWSMG